MAGINTCPWSGAPPLGILEEGEFILEVALKATPGLVFILPPNLPAKNPV